MGWTIRQSSYHGPPRSRRSRGPAALSSVTSLLLIWMSLVLGHPDVTRRAAYAAYLAPAGRWQTAQDSRLLSLADARQGRTARSGGLCMRIKRLSPEEQARSLADKEMNEKKSQVYLTQRVAYIRRMRAQYRLQVQTALPTPKTNKAWRDWVPPTPEEDGQGATAAAQPAASSSAGQGRGEAGRGAGAGVKSVYAEEEAREELRRVLPSSLLRPGDFAPLPVWSRLTHPQGQPTAYNHMKGSSQYVVVLAEPSFSTNNFFEGLKRLAIVPPELAVVVGVTVLSASEAGKVGKRVGLAPHTTVLSDEGRDWLRSYKIGDRSIERVMFVLEARLGTVLAVYRDPPPGAVNELLIETIGDWRKTMPPSPAK